VPNTKSNDFLSTTAKLEQSEELFSKAFNSSPAAIVISRLVDGYIVDVNQSFLRMLEYSRQEVVNHTSNELNIYTDLNERAHLVERLQKQGSVRNFEVSLQTKTGKPVVALVSIDKITLKGQEHVISTLIDITERKQAEEEISYLASFPALDSSPIVEVDFEGNISYINTAASALFPDLEVLGLAHPFLSDLRKVVKVFEGKITGAHYREIQVNGHWYYQEYFLVPNRTCLRIYSLNIDERKKAEEALRASEERYRLLFNSIDEGFCVIEMVLDVNDRPVDYRFIEINAQFENQTGLHEAKGKLMRSLAPDHEEHWFEIYGKVALTRQSVRFVNQAKALNRWYDVFAFPVGKEKIPKVGILFKDITERKKAEEELKESEERFSKAFTNSQAALAITRLEDGQYIDVNESFVLLSEFTKDELIGHTPKELRIYDPNERVKIVRTVREKGLVRDYELYAKTKTGKAKTVLFSMQPIMLNGQECAITTFIDITERKKAEDALKESEQLYRTLFENTEDGFQLLKPLYKDGKIYDGLILRVNKSYERQAGRKAEDVVGKTLREIVPDFDPYLISRGNEIVNEGKTVRIEYYNKTNDRWFDVYGFLYAKNQVGLLLRDITERKKTQEELRKAAERMEMAQQVAHVGTFEWDIQADVNRWTPQLEALYGLPPGGFRGTEEAWEQLVYFEDRAKMIALVNQAMETGGFEGEWRVVWPDGSIHWLLGRAWVFKGPSGKPQRLIGINIDITERKKAEETLKESEERFRIVADSTPAMLFVTNQEGHNQFINKYYREFFNIEHEKAAGNDWQSLYHPDDRSEYLRKVSEAICEKKPFTGQARVKRADGAWRWVETIATPRFSASKEYLGHVGLTIDITERKNLERQLKDSERLAAIGQVAGMVGHDIRNPLQAITGELFLAKTEIEEMPKSAKEEALKESLGFIEKQTGYIDKIVSDLQDYARPLKPDLVDTDLCSAVPEALSTVDIPPTIQAEMACDMPELKVKTDLTFLKRIMVNLVNNAVQAMPNGGKLTVRMSSKVGEAVITVEDNGVGIPKEVQDRLFTPLFTTKSKGQGFGLVAIKRMTEALGGTISFESEVGKGTKFIIKLPAK
jgi:PAS domain S-box-containing protein